MGCVICGAVEVLKRPSQTQWEYVADIWEVLNGIQSYDLFGCLAGVRNFANFKPLFPDRGFPENLSFQVRRELKRTLREECIAPTWFSYDEFRKVDWKEKALRPDDRVHEYELRDGREMFVGKGKFRAKLEEDGVYKELENAISVRRGDAVYRRVTMRRRDAMKGFGPVAKMMRALASTWGPQNVRSIIWFSW